MKVLIKENRNKGITFKEIPYPRLTDKGVIAKVLYAGICGSDLDIIENNNNFFEPPVVLGHEFCGEIIKVGNKVKGYKKGDVIVSELYSSSCNKCIYCKNKKYYLCKKRKALGWHKGCNGAFAEYIFLPERNLHKIDTRKISPVAAASIEPLAVCLEALCSNRNSLPQDNKLSLVSGPGPLGIISAQIIKNLFQSKVFFVGKDSSEPVRFKIAQKLGINNILNTDKIDILDFIMEKTENFGVDLAVEAAGNINSFDLCAKVIKNEGYIFEIGTINSKNFPWQILCTKNSNLIFSISASTQSWIYAIELLNEKKILLEPLVTHKFKLEEWKEAFEVAKNSRKSLKVLFEF